MIIPEGGSNPEYRDGRPYGSLQDQLRSDVDARFLFGPPKPEHPLAENQTITGCPTCGGEVIETVDEDGTPTYELLEGRDKHVDPS